MSLLKDIASAVGESARMSRTERREQETLTEEQKQAVNNMIQSAENGDVGAMATLANLYYEGTVLRYDPYEACRWWTEAANAGHVPSMYNLGILYAGEWSNMFYDEKKALYWLLEATNRGNADARDALNEYYKYSVIFQKWVRR